MATSPLFGRFADHPQRLAILCIPDADLGSIRQIPIASARASLQPAPMAYPRYCKKCGQPIIMSELFPGRWQPWEPDGSGRHQCGSGYRGGLSTIATTAGISGESGSQTYMTKCPFHCGQQVFYHTNGNGDTVFFDSIGWPWKVHPCWNQYWKEEQARRRVARYLGDILNQDIIQQEILIGAIVELSRRTGKNCFSELDIAKVMRLNLQEFKTLYGHLYHLESGNILILNSDISSRSLNKEEIQKLMLRRQLEWGIAKIPNVKASQFGIYGASEQEIAASLDYSLDRFRKIYGHLYVRIPNGIHFQSQRVNTKNKKDKNSGNKSKSEPQQAVKNKISVLADKSSFAKLDKPPKSRQVGKKKASALADKSSFAKLNKLQCPHCGQQVRHARDLSTHIQISHEISLAKSILCQAEKSGGRGQIICVYCGKSGRATKIRQHLKACSIFQSLRRSN